MLYTIGLTVGLFADRISPTVNMAFQLIPIFVGGFCFLLAAVLECVQSRVFRKFEWSVLWISGTMNLIGSVFFTTGGAFFLVSEDAPGNLSYGVGSLSYLISSLGSLLLWRDEQFGLLFLAEINKIGKSEQQKAEAWNESGALGREASIDSFAEVVADNYHRPQQKVHEEPDRFSLKSVVFVALYCWGAVMTCMAYL